MWWWRAPTPKAEAIARPNYAVWFANLTKLWRDFGAMPIRFARDFDEARQRGIAIAGTPVSASARRSSARSRPAACTYFVCRLMFGHMTRRRGRALVDRPLHVGSHAPHRRARGVAS